jgi:WD40 repeat protein
MFSGDRAGVLKVWDLATGSCVQTISKAHQMAITKVLVFEETYLLTGSLDGKIKCWSSSTGGTSIVNEIPEFVFEGEHIQQQRRGQQQVSCKGLPRAG